MLIASLLSTSNFLFPEMESILSESFEMPLSVANHLFPLLSKAIDQTLFEIKPSFSDIVTQLFPLYLITPTSE
ncbi:hypothetical protein ES708_14777 [subsurface metagenome]